MIDLDALERLAKVTDSRRWDFIHGPGESVVIAGHRQVIAACRYDEQPAAQAWNCAQYIAAANPTTVLALIARLRAAELVCLAMLGVVDLTMGAVEPDWAGNENWQDVKAALRAYLASKASR